MSDDSDSDGSESTGTAPSNNDDGAAPADDPMEPQHQQPRPSFGPQPPSDEQQRETERHQQGNISWFRRQQLYLLCQAYTENHYQQQGYSERSLVQRLSGLRRRCSGCTKDELVEMVRPQLLAQDAANMAHDVEVLHATSCHVSAAAHGHAQTACSAGTELGTAAPPAGLRGFYLAAHGHHLLGLLPGGAAHPLALVGANTAG